MLSLIAWVQATLSSTVLRYLFLPYARSTQILQGVVHKPKADPCWCTSMLGYMFALMTSQFGEQPAIAS